MGNKTLAFIFVLVTTQVIGHQCDRVTIKQPIDIINVKKLNKKISDIDSMNNVININRVKILQMIENDQTNKY